MILDVKIAGHHNYELFDADGNKLQYVVWADTESGRIKRCVMDNGKPRINEYGEWLFEELNVPAPLKAIKHEWRFSQEQIDDTILPKMDMSNMSMKNKSKLSKEVGEAIMGKSAKTDSLPISDGLVMYLHNAGDSGERYIRVDFNDYSTYKDFCMVMDRTKLREVADFIYKYLENI